MDLTEFLAQHGIHAARHEHPPVMTVEESERLVPALPGAKTKNLFLRNKKGDRHYLVILPIEKEADLRRLVKVIGDDRFSFASPDRLAKHLGLTPGSVSPFGLLNNPSHTVQVIVDTDLRSAGLLIFHPNLNAHSVTITGPDLERFLKSTGHVVRWMIL